MEKRNNRSEEERAAAWKKIARFEKIRDIKEKAEEIKTVKNVKLKTATLTLDQAEHNPYCNRPPAPGPDVPGPRGDVHQGGGDGHHAEQIPVPVDETASSSTTLQTAIQSSTINEADPRCVSSMVKSV